MNEVKKIGGKFEIKRGLFLIVVDIDKREGFEEDSEHEALIACPQ